MIYAKDFFPTHCAMLTLYFSLYLHPTFLQKRDPRWLQIAKDMVYTAKITVKYSIKVQLEIYFFYRLIFLLFNLYTAHVANFYSGHF